MATIFESSFVNASNNVSSNSYNSYNSGSSNIISSKNNNIGKNNNNYTAYNNNNNKNSGNIDTTINDTTTETPPPPSPPPPSPPPSSSPTKVSKFFSSNINYQSKIQQLISFSFSSSNFIFITCILSISKLCTTAATDAAQTNAPPASVSVSSGGAAGGGAAAAAAAAGSNFLLPNISGSMLLEKLNAFRVTTLGPPTAVEGKAVVKSSSASVSAAANSVGKVIGNGNGNGNGRYGNKDGALGSGNTVLGSKGLINIKFKYLNVSGKIGTSLDLAQYQYKKCEEKQFQCNNGYCIPIRFVCDGDPDCDDHSDEMIPECKSVKGKSLNTKNEKSTKIASTNK